MQTTYQVLCRLHQRHDYFQDPYTPSVALTPTLQTAQNLRRAGLLLKSTPRGLALLRSEAVGEEAPRRPLPDFLFPLRFRLQPLSPYFENYTELARTPRAGTLYYVVAPATRSVDSVALPVSKDSRLPLRPLVFCCSLPKGADPTELSILDLDRQVERPAVGPGPTGQVTVDLRPWQEGRYQLRHGATALLDFYADAHLYASQAWGILELSEAALATAPTFELQFAPRHTHWKYLIACKHPSADRYRAAPQNLSVAAAPDPAVRATLPAVSFRQEPPTMEGVHAVFVSEQPIALAERPRYTCTLRFQPPGSTRSDSPGPALVVALPRAGVELSKPLLAAGRPADPAAPTCTEIFVHL
ncbi:hypothetical protein LJY25_02780 [Hymenobacter sp. BT175]|uniref:hypothetical protein n=1 Tax=Hymenobacter translucens TaxID=2886507 RepID=UPI001D0F41A2|nr:hypothetical protein [Hymenobacter translucens]MCC2545356.1 hypothetical protein [Hymenobacter translucens]